MAKRLPQHEQEARRMVLKAAISACGNGAELGRRMGHRNGNFVNQMARGVRPITEKTMGDMARIGFGATVLRRGARLGNPPSEGGLDALSLLVTTRRIPLLSMEEFAVLIQVPEAFWLPLPDSGLGRRAPAGTLALFARDAQPAIGDAVLITLRDRVMVREFGQCLDAGCDWVARGRGGLADVHAATPGVKIAGVLKALGADWRMLGE